MPAFITFGRILFAVIFIASGASKFLDLPATADMIGSRIVPTFPAAIAPYSTQLETLAGMEMKQILAILAATIELLGGVLIALNLGTRFFALLMVVFVIAQAIYMSRYLPQDGTPSAAEAKDKQP